MIEALRQLQNAQLCPANDEIKHHLSVELIPWHTPNTSSKQFKDYVKNNAKAIVDNSIAFAADRSLQIPSSIATHGKVIMRMNYDVVKNIFNHVKNITDESYQPMSLAEDNFDNVWKFAKFTIPRFSDVSFLCIWGVRNYLPNPTILKQLIEL
jgi:hypothetical protein